MQMYCSLFLAFPGRLLPTSDQVQASELAKDAMRLIGMAAENKALTLKKFIYVRDYLLVTTLYENSSRLGPLENCKISCFQQVTYCSSNDCCTITFSSGRSVYFICLIICLHFIYFYLFFNFLPHHKLK